MRFRRRNWVKTDGRVLDSRIRTVHRSPVPLHNYVVEFRAPDGETKRLEVEQTVKTVRVSIGDEVPLLVKPDGTEAVFDHKDPRVGVRGYLKAREQAEKERFRQQIEG